MEEAEHALWREAGLTIARAGEETGFPRLAQPATSTPPFISRRVRGVGRVARITRRTLHYTFS